MEDNTPPPFAAPPPLQSPPPIIVPPPPTPPRKSRGWMVISIILFLLLAVSVMANLGALFRSFTHLSGISGTHQRFGGPRLDEVVLEDNDGSEKIAVIPIEGVISGELSGRGGYSLVDVVKAQLDRAEDDKKVKAVILKVDSPGGEVLASDEIARAITEFQSHAGKPVIVSMGSLAASGGYYVSAPCEWIVANELTITGSIGVIMHGFNYRGLMDKVGLVPEVYKSGKFKDMLSGSREPGSVTPEERAMVQKLIDETYAKFKSVVAEGRKNAHESNKNGQVLASDWADYADGRVLSGKEAFKLGFVDQLGTFDDAVGKAEELGGVKDQANLIEYRQRNDLAELFGLFGQSESRAFKVDLGLDLPKLQAGRMYFLSPLFLH
jgi:protease IV